MNDTVRESLPEFIDHQLVHFRQRYDWDCGLSCIVMLLGRHEKLNFLENFKDICHKGGFGESTWTIDLCYILRDFDIKHKFLTKVFGANPSHVGKEYYKCFNADETRVNKKFQQASLNDIPIEVKSISNIELIKHLAFNGNVILLTNASLLYCDLCKANKLSIELRSCLGLKPTYMGHYIVLCGYDMRIEKFLYRNPAFKDKICYMSFEAVERARKACGTDEDVILIYDKRV
ncbi:protein GUCD1 [Uranotaenia lowii]|uniref:protein GUCD1 n=1 Tax=Uranotaenia lowii TaxID=190385 RepID=UPI00247871A6|nr:protein GUCD1 [Uranotaenia lowii]